jgi:uncharacterized YkwD family protein
MKEFLKRNKFIILFFLLLIILACATCSRVFAYTYEALDFKYGKVKAECLNVRCGPGINYNRVGKIYKDEYIDIFAKVGDWYIIQTNSNLIGAVSVNYVEAVYNEEEVLEANSNNEEQEITEISSENGINVTQESSLELENTLELKSDEQEFLDLINANRVNNGLEELKVDYDIENIARLKAKDLNENNYFSHNSPTYGNIDEMFDTFEISYIDLGENIAGNKNLAGAVEAWMNSENHKSNILSSEFNYTGVAIVESQTYGKIFVEIFAKK